MNCLGAYFHMPKPVITFVFQVLRNALLPYIYNTLHMPKPVIRFVFQVWSNALLRYIRYTHAQTCDCVPVQSATQGVASLHTLHKPISCDNVPVQSAQQCTASVHIQHFTHAQTCDNVRVPSVKQCTASILSHARACDNVRLFKFYAMHWFGTLVHLVLYTCPNLW